MLGVGVRGAGGGVDLAAAGVEERCVGVGARRRSFNRSQGESREGCVTLQRRRRGRARQRCVWAERVRIFSKTFKSGGLALDILYSGSGKQKGPLPSVGRGGAAARHSRMFTHAARR